MKIPVVRGLIDRRLLVNFRVDPAVLARIIPRPFRPKLIRGFGMAGIWLIRLKYIRPRFVPRLFGIASENAAHRIAVEWDQGGRRKEGVFIPRRDTSSRVNALAGGRIFPGVHHHARFDVFEQEDRYRVIMESDDAQARLGVEGVIAAELPRTSVFSSLQEASEFFERGSVGYSVTGKQGLYDGLELRSFHWHVRPLAVEWVESSFFEDESVFPPGSVELDCTLLMREIEHEWHGRESLVAHEAV